MRTREPTKDSRLKANRGGSSQIFRLSEEAGVASGRVLSQPHAF
jgi:hypothetical protein